MLGQCVHADTHNDIELWTFEVDRLDHEGIRLLLNSIARDHGFINAFDRLVNVDDEIVEVLPPNFNNDDLNTVINLHHVLNMETPGVVTPPRAWSPAAVIDLTSDDEYSNDL